MSAFLTIQHLKVLCHPTSARLRVSAWVLGVLPCSSVRSPIYIHSWRSAFFASVSTLHPNHIRTGTRRQYGKHFKLLDRRVNRKNKYTGSWYNEYGSYSRHGSFVQKQNSRLPLHRAYATPWHSAIMLPLTNAPMRSSGFHRISSLISIHGWHITTCFRRSRRRHQQRCHSRSRRDHRPNTYCASLVHTT